MGCANASWARNAVSEQRARHWLPSQPVVVSDRRDDRDSRPAFWYGRAAAMRVVRNGFCRCSDRAPRFRPTCSGSLSARSPHLGAHTSGDRRHRGPSFRDARSGMRDVGYPASAYSCQVSGTPLSSWVPRSLNSIPEPTTRSFTVRDTSTSLPPASATTRAPM